MEKTLESIFIEQYEELKKELELKNKQIEELKSKKVEEEQEKKVEPVVFKTFSKECCKLDVTRSYNIIRTSHFKDLTSEQIKKIIEDDEKIKEYAKLPNDYYSYRNDSLVEISTNCFPYSAVIQGHVVMLSTNKYSDFEVNAYVLENKNNLKENRWFDIKEKERLYQYGLDLFKKELEKAYKEKLNSEQEESK